MEQGEIPVEVGNKAVNPKPSSLIQGELRLNNAQASISALANHQVLEEDKKEQPLAKKEFVYNDEGKINDIKFLQNGQRATLKSVLPGSYTIEHTHYTQEKDKRGWGGVADEYHNKLSVNDMSDDTEPRFNLRLLHEAGHMFDYTSHKVDYRELQKAKVIAAIRKNIFNSKGSIKYTDKIEWKTLKLCQRIIKKNAWRFTYEDIEEINQAYHEALTQNYSIEDFLLQGFEEGEKYWRLNAMLKVMQERNAWANAVKAIRRLKEQGITVFNGTEEELREAVKWPLWTYEMNVGVDLSPTDRHFIKLKET